MGDGLMVGVVVELDEGYVVGCGEEGVVECGEMGGIVVGVGYVVDVVEIYICVGRMFVCGVYDEVVGLCEI